MSTFRAHDVCDVLQVHFYQLLEEHLHLFILSQKVNEIIATKQDRPATKKQAACTEFSRNP